MSTLEVPQTTDGVLYHQEIELQDYSDGVGAKLWAGVSTSDCLLLCHRSCPAPSPPPIPPSPPLFVEPLSVESWRNHTPQVLTFWMQGPPSLPSSPLSAYPGPSLPLQKFSVIDVFITCYWFCIMAKCHLLFFFFYFIWMAPSHSLFYLWWWFSHLVSSSLWPMDCSPPGPLSMAFPRHEY